MRLVIRPAASTDHRFIAAAWSRGWKRPAESSLLTATAWCAAAFATVEDLLAHADARRVQVLVAADADSAPGDVDLFGFLAWYVEPSEPLPLVLFCFVKAPARRGGIARALFARAGIDLRAPFPYVCHTHAAAELRAAGVIPHAQWRPDLGRLTNDLSRKD